MSIRSFAISLGTEGEFLEDSILYGSILLAALPAYILQAAFQCLFATAGKPAIGFYVTLASEVVNIILDAVFIIFYFHGGLRVQLLQRLLVKVLVVLCHFSILHVIIQAFCSLAKQRGISMHCAKHARMVLQNY